MLCSILGAVVCMQQPLGHPGQVIVQLCTDSCHTCYKSDLKCCQKRSRARHCMRDCILVTASLKMMCKYATSCCVNAPTPDAGSSCADEYIEALRFACGLFLASTGKCQEVQRNEAV